MNNKSIINKEIETQKSILKEQSKLYESLGGWDSDDNLTQQQLDDKDDYLTNILAAKSYLKDLKAEITFLKRIGA